MFLFAVFQVLFLLIVVAVFVLLFALAALITVVITIIVTIIILRPEVDLGKRPQSAQKLLPGHGLCCAARGLFLTRNERRRRRSAACFSLTRSSSDR